MSDTLIIQNIAFDADGSVQIAYLMPEQDVKANGILHIHTICIPAGDDYDDELDAITEAARYAVRDALEDLPELDALKP